MWLRSSMVEQATHNRQATGSNPVGAISLHSKTINHRRIVGCAMAWSLFLGGWITATPVSAQEADPPLRGLASLSGVAASALRASDCLPGCRRDMGVQCVQVHIQNNTDQPITVNGNEASGMVGTASLPVASEPVTEKESGCGLTAADVGLLAVIGVTTVGFGQDMLFERLTTPKTLGEAFFRDGARHKVEGVRFGRRLLMPGDETTGWLCFNGSITPDTVSLPVAGMDGKQAGELKLSVAGAAAPPIPQGKIERR
jgi:hypothetical protein